jgi:hypothetical protein
MGLHTWNATIHYNNSTIRLGGVNDLPESPDRTKQYPPDVLLDSIVRDAANREYGPGLWSVAKMSDPYAWNAYPAADRGFRR